MDSLHFKDHLNIIFLPLNYFSHSELWLTCFWTSGGILPKALGDHQIDDSAIVVISHFKPFSSQKSKLMRILIMSHIISWGLKGFPKITHLFFPPKFWMNILGIWDNRIVPFFTIKSNKWRQWLIPVDKWYWNAWCRLTYLPGHRKCWAWAGIPPPARAWPRPHRAPRGPTRREPTCGGSIYAQKGERSDFLSQLMEQMESPLGWLRLERRTGWLMTPVVVNTWATGSGANSPSHPTLAPDMDMVEWKQSKCCIIFWKQDQHLIFLPHNYWLCGFTSQRTSWNHKCIKCKMRIKEPQ